VSSRGNGGGRQAESGRGISKAAAGRVRIPFRPRAGMSTKPRTGPLLGEGRFTCARDYRFDPRRSFEDRSLDFVSPVWWRQTQ